MLGLQILILPHFSVMEVILKATDRAMMVGESCDGLLLPRRLFSWCLCFVIMSAGWLCMVDDALLSRYPLPFHLFVMAIRQNSEFRLV